MAISETTWIPWRGDISLCRRRHHWIPLEGGGRACRRCGEVRDSAGAVIDDGRERYAEGE